MHTKGCKTSRISLSERQACTARLCSVQCKSPAEGIEFNTKFTKAIAYTTHDSASIFAHPDLGMVVQRADLVFSLGQLCRGRSRLLPQLQLILSAQGCPGAPCGFPSCRVHILQVCLVHLHHKHTQLVLLINSCAHLQSRTVLRQMGVEDAKHMLKHGTEVVGDGHSCHGQELSC